MHLHTKALYNLLRYSFSENEDNSYELWQVEDLSQLDSKLLFERLNDFDINLDKDSYILYAEKVENPEDLTSLFLVDEKLKNISDKIYLIFFELWKRLLPEKKSISIICDELDNLIELYDKGTLSSFDSLEDALANLLEMLEDNMDQGNLDPEFFMEQLSPYLAHDIESFLYDFIADRIDEKDDLYAGDLLERAYPYMYSKSWFDFLRARIYTKSDVSIANDILTNILSNLKKEFDLDLSLELLFFMREVGDPNIFIHVARLTLDHIEREDDFIDYLENIIDFYRRLDLEKNVFEIEEILKKRKQKKLFKINVNDKDILFIKNFLNKNYQINNIK